MKKIPVYLGGYCSIGKNALAVRLSQVLNEKGFLSRPIQDPADVVFRKYFGITLPRSLAARIFVSQPHEFFKASMDYLETFEAAAKEEKLAIVAESPSLAFSHALFFGVSVYWSTEEKELFWQKSMRLLRKGVHFLVQGWCHTKENTLRWEMQRLFLKGRTNVKIIGPYSSYQEIQEKGLKDILEVIL